MEEHWTYIEGIDNYEISSLGRMRHTKHKRIKKYSIVRNQSITSIRQYGKVKTFVVKRLVIDNLMEKPQGTTSYYIDGNPLNNAVTNIGFRKERGINKRGKYILSCSNNILSDFNQGIGITTLMKKYKSDYKTIKNILISK